MTIFHEVICTLKRTYAVRPTSTGCSFFICNASSPKNALAKSLKKYNIHSPTDEQMLAVIFDFLAQEHDPDLLEFRQQLHEKSKQACGCYNMNCKLEKSSKAELLAGGLLLLARNPCLNTPENHEILQNQFNDSFFMTNVRSLYMLEQEELLDQKSFQGTIKLQASGLLPELKGAGLLNHQNLTTVLDLESYINEDTGTFFIAPLLLKVALNKAGSLNQAIFDELVAKNKENYRKAFESDVPAVRALNEQDNEITHESAHSRDQFFHAGLSIMSAAVLTGAAPGALNAGVLSGVVRI